ncbi:MAG: type IA DNA topoisomerase [Lachnospiraceae bacterium]|nr:type IA DNA topoisomerase [Lachnospiraceae bacterium]
MGKYLYIAEKPSVAQEFAKALKCNFKKRDGYLEAEDALVTWCVGHLVTMSYPEVYDPALKRWTLESLPFLPQDFKYEVIPSVSKQFNIVKTLLNRADVERIYVCTDSGREGEYIYRLVDQMAGVPSTKDKRRVWIDSQTEEEILRGIKGAKPLSDYDHLSDAAYLRAMEDYLMGINFSRVLTLKYGNAVSGFLKSEKRAAISVGRVMTCVLGMVVRREREIRAFVKTPFFRVMAGLSVQGHQFEGEFRAVEGSRYFRSPKLYKENGFKEKKDAQELLALLLGQEVSYHKTTENGKNSYAAVFDPEQKKLLAQVTAIEKKKENKYAPLLFNLAELQNECSRLFKISPDETLKIVQELYEKKLVTYPRTDARVLSTAVAKEIHKNIGGMGQLAQFAPFTKEILGGSAYKEIAKTRYVNDKQITDHYAIIPTGQGLSALSGLPLLSKRVYVAIAKRFLCIFYPPAVYQKVSLTVKIDTESFFASFKVLMEEGYLKVANAGKQAAQGAETPTEDGGGTGKSLVGANQGQADASTTAQAADPGAGAGKKTGDPPPGAQPEEESFGKDFFDVVKGLKKGAKLNVTGFTIREGETAPPKRYNSGSMILAMENAGQLIEDEELRAQIKGSGIGTSATRAEILNKLVKISYLNLNKKTQVITPTQTGEMIFEVVNTSIRSLLNAELTASWEKGLTYVAQGTISREEYLKKLEGFVGRLTNAVKGSNNQGQLHQCFAQTAANYPLKGGKAEPTGSTGLDGS